MIRSFFVLSLIAYASAFLSPSSFNSLNYPLNRERTGNVLMAQMTFENAPGVVAPLGYWDPLGFSEEGDEEKFNRYRAIELKHGRIAMLAMTHIFVTHFIKLPGYLSTSKGLLFSDVPSGLAAIKAVPAAGWAQILLFQSALEILAPQDPTKAPGDVQPDTPSFPKLEKYDEEGAMDIQNKELNNGRLAMMAIAGTWASDALTGSEDVVDVLLGKLYK